MPSAAASCDTVWWLSRKPFGVGGRDLAASGPASAEKCGQFAVHPRGRPCRSTWIRGAVGLGYERGAVVASVAVYPARLDREAVEPAAGRAAARGPRRVSRCPPGAERVAVGEGATGIGRGGVRRAVAVEVRGRAAPRHSRRAMDMSCYVQRWRARLMPAKIVAGLGSAAPWILLMKLPQIRDGA